MATLKYWLWLTNLRGLSASAGFRVLEHFGTPESAYFADPTEYKMVEGLSTSAQSALMDKCTDKAETILADCDRLGVHILTIQDAQYPERLCQLSDPPAVLYVKGRIRPFDEEAAVGVVGAREATPYGIKMAGKLGMDLARQGAIVVSGIAMGVDTSALRGALLGGGSVVSVLGNGVDVVYPAANHELYDDVAAAGALISEYPPGTEPNSRYFPVRNRIISGLSLGVVIVEGKQTSGALITARLALDQNRDAFAVPGNADAPMSQGPNLLIRRGEAKLVTSAWDVLEEYYERFPHKIRRIFSSGEVQEQRPDQKENKNNFIGDEEKMVDKAVKRTYIDLKDTPMEFTDDEREILLALADRALVADDIIEITQIPARRVLSALTMLQIQGLVEENPGKQFRASAIFQVD